MDHPYCYYSFKPLNPHNPDPSLRTFVICANCGKAYHEKYWNRLNKCLYCGSTHAKLLVDVPEPSKQLPIIRTPLLITARRMVWSGPWWQNPNNLWLMAGVIGLMVVAVLAGMAFIYIRQEQIRFEATRAAATQAVLNLHQTQTETARPTSTPTPTFTSTSIPTLTPLVTNIPDPTFKPPIKPLKTPEPTRKTCPGAPPIRVEIGDTARVTYNNGKKLYMRSAPVVSQNVQWYLYGGNKIQIIAGPECANDVSFFKVEDLSNGHIGWVAEADADSTNYLIEVIP